MSKYYNKKDYKNARSLQEKRFNSKKNTIRYDAFVERYQDLSMDGGKTSELGGDINYLSRHQYHLCMKRRNKLSQRIEKQKKRLNDLEQGDSYFDNFLFWYKGIESLERKIQKVEAKAKDAEEAGKKKEAEKLRKKAKDLEKLLSKRKEEKRKLLRKMEDDETDHKIFREMMSNIDTSLFKVTFHKIRKARKAFNAVRRSRREARERLEKIEKKAVERFSKRFPKRFPNESILDEGTLAKKLADAQEQINKKPADKDEKAHADFAKAQADFVLLNQLNDANKDLNELRDLAKGLEKDHPITPEKMIELGEKVELLQHAQNARRKALNSYGRALKGSLSKRRKNGLAKLNEKIGILEELEKKQSNAPPSGSGPEFTPEDESKLKNLRRLQLRKQRDQLLRKMEGLKADHEAFDKLIADAPRTKEGLEALKVQVEEYKSLIDERKAALRELKKAENLGSMNKVDDCQQDYDNVKEVMARAMASPFDERSEQLKRAKAEIRNLKKLQKIRDEARRKAEKTKELASKYNIPNSSAAISDNPAARKANARAMEYEAYQELNKKITDRGNGIMNSLDHHLEQLRVGRLDRLKGKAGIFDHLDESRQNLNEAEKQFKENRKKYKGFVLYFILDRLHAERDHEAIQKLISETKNKIPAALGDVHEKVKKLTEAQEDRRKAAKVLREAQKEYLKRQARIMAKQERLGGLAEKLIATQNAQKNPKLKALKLKLLHAQIKRERKQVEKEKKELEEKYAKKIMVAEENEQKAALELEKLTQEYVPGIKSLKQMEKEASEEASPYSPSSPSVRSTPGVAQSTPTPLNTNQGQNVKVNEANYKPNKAPEPDTTNASVKAGTSPKPTPKPEAGAAPVLPKSSPPSSAPQTAPVNSLAASPQAVEPPKSQLTQSSVASFPPKPKPGRQPSTPQSAPSKAASTTSSQSTQTTQQQAPQTNAQPSSSPTDAGEPGKEPEAAAKNNNWSTVLTSQSTQTTQQQAPQTNAQPSSSPTDTGEPGNWSTVLTSSKASPSPGTSPSQTQNSQPANFAQTVSNLKGTFKNLQQSGSDVSSNSAQTNKPILFSQASKKPTPASRAYEIEKNKPKETKPEGATTEIENADDKAKSIRTRSFTA